MASTNKTTNYELSQYIGTDKPTYLTDYNQDMSKIDAGIHAAKSEADTNATSIGTLSSLNTDVKTSLVAALNEVDGHADTNAGNIATNTSNIATNTTHIGTVANLTTASKTDLVVAANEINSKVGNIANLDTNAKNNLVSAINEVNYNVDLLTLNNFVTIDGTNMTFNNASVVSSGNLTLAYNDSGTLCKVYGDIKIEMHGSENICTYNSPLRPETDITVNCLGTAFDDQSSDYTSWSLDLTIKTNGDITFTCWKPGFGDYNKHVIFRPCLIFVKDFGDTPQPAPVGV